ncbi:MAG: hypothetical protein K6C97_06505 [Treponema sp.]|nr:hypothetical protein [Treponema sp.]
MKKMFKKILISLCVLGLFSASLFAQASGTNYTSAENVKKAQVAMATNEYVVTAGDIYTLAFAAGSFSLSVDSTYRVRIANLGFINAQGLTLQEFKSRVEALVVSNYPAGGIQFFLTNPAQFHVFVKGEVQRTATVETWALQHVSEIIPAYYTGYSSQRFVKILSADGKETTYDLYKAFYDGDFSQDPYLRPGDTILIQKLDRRVSIGGEVIRGGTYELLPGEELHSLIYDYAKGFTPFADKENIEIDSYIGGNPLYQAEYIKETDLHSDRPLACYDSVFIPYLGASQSAIYVEGAVSNRYDVNTKTLVAEYDDDGEEITNLPGDVTSAPSSIARLKFTYTKGKSCVQLVKENPVMFLNSADLSEAYVWRKAKNKDEEDQKLAIDLRVALFPTQSDTLVEDIILEAEDVLVIPYTQYYVNVTGAVSEPGKYAYQHGRTWEYYIALANGLDYDQNLFKAVKITDKHGKKLSKKSVIPPEATIYASRNSPNNGWFFPLLTAILTFITTCFTCVAAVQDVF